METHEVGVEADRRSGIAKHQPAIGDRGESGELVGDVGGGSALIGEDGDDVGEAGRIGG